MNCVSKYREVVVLFLQRGKLERVGIDLSHGVSLHITFVFLSTFSPHFFPLPYMKTWESWHWSFSWWQPPSKIAFRICISLHIHLYFSHDTFVFLSIFICIYKTWESWHWSFSWWQQAARSALLIQKEDGRRGWNINVVLDHTSFLDHELFTGTNIILFSAVLLQISHNICIFLRQYFVCHFNSASFSLNVIPSCCSPSTL